MNAGLLLEEILTMCSLWFYHYTFWAAPTRESISFPHFIHSGRLNALLTMVGKQPCKNLQLLISIIVIAKPFNKRFTLTSIPLLWNGLFSRLNWLTAVFFCFKDKSYFQLSSVKNRCEDVSVSISPSATHTRTYRERACCHCCIWRQIPFSALPSQTKTTRLIS